jgi:phage baseplate assembly protein gpV
MKVWVYRFDDGKIVQYDHQLHSKEINNIVGFGKMDFIGNNDLPLEPVKKEVEKEIEPEIHQRNGYYIVSGTIPDAGYDAVIKYKIKE